MVWSFIRRFYNSSSKKNITNIQHIYNNLNNISNLQFSIQNPIQCRNIQNGMKYMNSLTLNELGIGKDLPLEIFKEPVCMEICNTPRFTLAVFILPQGCKLPIHDHPHMCVLCKLVTGRLNYRSFTPETNSRDYICHELIKTQDDPAWFLTPENGNFHELTAQENCVLFDALLPPYHEPERCCSYYDANHVDGVKWRLQRLEEEPSDLLPYGVPYLGDRPIL